MREILVKGRLPPLSSPTAKKVYANGSGHIVVVKRGGWGKGSGQKRGVSFFPHLIHLFPSEKEEEDVKSLSAPFSTPTVSVLSPCIQIGEFPLMAVAEDGGIGRNQPYSPFPSECERGRGKNSKGAKCPKREEGRKEEEGRTELKQRLEKRKRGGDGMEGGGKASSSTPEVRKKTLHGNVPPFPSPSPFLTFLPEGGRS